MIKQWDIVISGWMQQRGADNGSDLLWGKLRRFQSLTRELLLYEWHDDMERLARRIVRHSDRNEVPVIRVYAYSWGAGHAFPRLAESLSRVADFGIDIAVLADPVYRSRWLPWWLPINALSLTRIPRITVPFNVARVEWLRQKISSPAGHDLVAEDESMTVISKPVTLNRPHIGFDSAGEYHSMAISAAERPFARLATDTVSKDEE